MSDTTQIILAIIAIIVPTVTVIFTWLQSRVKIAEVHTVVNSKHAEALAIIKTLETEIRRLNLSPGQATEPAAVPANVTLSPDGQVIVAKDPVVNAPPGDIRLVPEQGPLATVKRK